MKKYVVICLLLAACTNTATNDTKADTTAKQPSPVTTVANDDEMNFVDACVENSKQRLGEAKAYATCKCIYDQVKQKNPSGDSAAMDAILADTTQIAAMAAKCK